MSVRVSIVVVSLFLMGVLSMPALAQDDDGSAAEDQYAPGPDEGCENPQEVTSFTGTENQRTDPFEITGETFRLRYETAPEGADPFLPTVEVDVLNAQGQPTGEGFLAFEGEDGTENVLAGPGTFRLEIRAEDASYRITVEDCTETAQEPPPDDQPGDVDDPDDVVDDSIPDKPLPNTGGVPLVGLVLFAAGSLGVGTLILRRR
jgi:hypothetical protein